MDTTPTTPATPKPAESIGERIMDGVRSAETKVRELFSHGSALFDFVDGAERLVTDLVSKRRPGVRVIEEDARGMLCVLPRLTDNPIAIRACAILTADLDAQKAIDAKKAGK